GFVGGAQLRRRADLRRAWLELIAARRRHAEATRDRAAIEGRLAELEALAAATEGLTAGLEDELRAERERLRHVTELAAAAGAAAAEALSEAQGKVAALTGALGESRAAAAGPFAEAVTEELRAIGLEDGIFETELRERELGPTGADEVVFLVRLNQGLPLAPV